MSLIAKDLKAYAGQGLRTPEDWLGHGRQVLTDSKPRCAEKFGTHVISLYSRDQTKARRSTRVR